MESDQCPNRDLKRHFDNSDIPKGMTRNLLVFSLALAIAYAIGWAVQGVSIGLGFVVPAMFFLGVVFGGLWATAYFLGIRIDRERAERAVLEEQWRTEQGAEHGAGPGSPASGDTPEVS